MTRFGLCIFLSKITHDFWLWEGFIFNQWKWSFIFPPTVLSFASNFRLVYIECSNFMLLLLKETEETKEQVKNYCNFLRIENSFLPTEVILVYGKRCWLQISNDVHSLTTGACVESKICSLELKILPLSLQPLFPHVKMSIGHQSPTDLRSEMIFLQGKPVLYTFLPSTSPLQIIFRFCWNGHLRGCKSESRSPDIFPPFGHSRVLSLPYET